MALYCNVQNLYFIVNGGNQIFVTTRGQLLEPTLKANKVGTLTGALQKCINHHHSTVLLVTHHKFDIHTFCFCYRFSKLYRT
jgi:hypothetical protein